MDFVHLNGFSVLQYFCAYFAFALFDRSAKAQEWTMLPPSKTRYFKFSVGGILCTGLCEGGPLYRRRLCWMSCSCARGWHCERGGVGWLEQGAEVVSRALTCT